ncbi:MAG: hypothetical protein OQK58_11195 [Gammaproteobacteria bacterium]|nr:hypothetical protein [Gammaproteobacteria bacterium]
MNTLKFIKSFILSLSLVLGLSACVYDPYYSGPGPVHHTYHPYYYPYYYDYYFYPSVQVYFNFSTGFYYYLSGKRWIRSKTLPAHIRLDTRERVTTRIEGDKPYLKNEQHLQQYKPRPDYRPDPKIHRQEQLQNFKSYEQHQKKQEVYEKKWEKEQDKRKQRR